MTLAEVRAGVSQVGLEVEMEKCLMKIKQRRKRASLGQCMVLVRVYLRICLNTNFQPSSLLEIFADMVNACECCLNR